jgi:hypothetical protein
VYSRGLEGSSRSEVAASRLEVVRQTKAQPGFGTRLTDTTHTKGWGRRGEKAWYGMWTVSGFLKRTKQISGVAWARAAAYGFGRIDLRIDGGAGFR